MKIPIDFYVDLFSKQKKPDSRYSILETENGKTVFCEDMSLDLEKLLAELEFDSNWDVEAYCELEWGDDYCSLDKFEQEAKILEMIRNPNYIEKAIWQILDQHMED